jgi:KRAB domain-containing zinc finger protein
MILIFLFSENHIRATHNPPQLRECLGCKQSFRHFQNYLQHLAKENCEQECTSKAIHCPLCKKRKYFANSQDALDIHNKINHTERPPNPYKCFKCDATFCRKGHLKQHGLLHHKEGAINRKAFQCSICTRAFSYNRDRISHENSHKNSSDNYEECNKKATVVGVVVENSDSKSDRHHYRRLQYTCTECDAVFFQTRSLKKHALIEHQMGNIINNL